MTNIALNTPGPSTESFSRITSANNAAIVAHNHGTISGASIVDAVISAVVGDDVDGAIAGIVQDMLEANFFKAPYAHLIGADINVSANTKVPFATIEDQSSANKGAFASAAALTGTVSKTASSAAVVGVGTLFTSELSVGQLISIPGTAAEVRAVTVITDNTHLTVSAAFANSASAQTATRKNTGYVVRVAGVYDFNIQSGLTSITAGLRTMGATVNDVDIPRAQKIVAIAGDDLADGVAFTMACSLWDVIEPYFDSDESTSPFVAPSFTANFRCLP